MKNAFSGFGLLAVLAMMGFSSCCCDKDVSCEDPCPPKARCYEPRPCAPKPCPPRCEPKCYDGGSY